MTEDQKQAVQQEIEFSTVEALRAQIGPTGWRYMHFVCPDRDGSLKVAGRICLCYFVPEAEDDVVVRHQDNRLAIINLHALIVPQMTVFSSAARAQQFVSAVNAVARSE